MKLPKNQWLSGSQRGDYLAFLTDQPVERYVLVGQEYAWRDWLNQKYGSLDALNQSHQAAYTVLDDVRLPVDQLEMQ